MLPRTEAVSGMPALAHNLLRADEAAERTHLALAPQNHGENPNQTKIFRHLEPLACQLMAPMNTESYLLYWIIQIARQPQANAKAVNMNEKWILYLFCLALDTRAFSNLVISHNWKYYLLSLPNPFLSIRSTQKFRILTIKSQQCKCRC